MRAESIVIFIVLSSSALAIVSGYAQGRSIAPRRWIVLLLMLLFVCAVGVAMLLGLGSLLLYKTLGAAAVFLLGLVGPTAVILIGMPIARRLASRRGPVNGSLGPVERIFFLPTAFAGDRGPSSLGRAASQIQVLDGTETLRLELPARRSRRTWAMGVGALCLLIMPLYTIISTLFGSALLLRDGEVLPALLLALLSIVTAVLRNLPWILLSAWGWYVLFGTEVVAVHQDRATVRKDLWHGTGMTYRTISYTPSESVQVDVGQDTAGRCTVRLRLDRPVLGRRWDREFEFGAGRISDRQAAQLSEAIVTWLSRPGLRSLQAAHPSNPGFEQTVQALDL